MLGLAGDAGGRELIAIAIEPAGQAQAQGAGVELVGLALAVEGDGRDEKTLRAGLHQPAVQHEAEAARLGHAKDLEALGDPAFDQRDQFVVGELARGQRVGVIFLHHGHDEFQMHVQAELEQRFAGSDDAAR